IAWLMHTMLWCLMPTLLLMLLAEPVVNSAGPVSREQLAILSSGMLLLLIVVHLGLRRPSIVPVTRFFDEHAPPVDRLLWPMALAFVLLVIVERTLNSIFGTSFAEVVAFAVTADNSTRGQSALLETMEVMLLGFAIAIISLGRVSGITRGTLVLAWISIVTFCGFLVARGIRSVVLLPVVVGFVALSTLQGRTRRRAAWLVAAGGMAVIVIGAPVAAIMGVARGGTGGVSTQLIEEAYYVVFGSRSVTEQAQLLAAEVHKKFDAVGPGVELLALEPPGTAGVVPFISATVSPIPRVLYPTKPVPTSRDGTYLGSPYRVAAQAYGNVDAGQVVPVSASAIALWEFGGVGPLVLLVMNLINLVLLNTIFLSRNVLARAVSISLLGLPLSEFFVGTPSALVQNDLRLILYLTFLAAVSLAARLLFRKQRVVDVAAPALPTPPSPEQPLLPFPG
ncbi:MAG: hypothetical protein ABI120_07460, partial [Gemmatimonadaceae bacterium]